MEESEMGDKFMKKRANINFILIIILTVAMLLVPAILGIALIDLDSDMESLKSEISVALEDDEMDDVEGYGVIAEGVGYGLGAFAGALVFAVALLVGGYAILLFVVALIARLVFAKEGKRLVVYRILMGLEYILQLGILIFFVDMLSGGFQLGALLLMLLVLAELVYGCVNTFTKRILK